MVNDRSVNFEFQELSEVFLRMADEYLIAMPYEYEQQCFQITEDQGIEDCHSCFSCYFKNTTIV